MKKFTISALVTISVFTQVEAKDEESALEIAESRGTQRLCCHCASPRTENQEWVTSGELDGMPFDLRIDP